MSTCILVLGMHRSGTSVVAGVLHSLGVHMGDVFRQPDQHNETGYWEDLVWRGINHTILRTAQSTWYEPPSLEQLAEIEDWVSPIIAEVVKLKSQVPLWGFKDPRVCLTISLIYPHLPEDTRYVYVRRDEDEVVASLMRRAEARGYYEPPEHWANLYKIYNDRVLAFLAKHPGPMFLIAYDQLVKESECHLNVEALARFVGIKDRDRMKTACQLIKPR